MSRAERVLLALLCTLVLCAAPACEGAEADVAPAARAGASVTTDVARLIAEQFELSAPRAPEVALDTILIDDLARVELALALEERFELEEIDDAETMRWRTVQDVADYVGRRAPGR